MARVEVPMPQMGESIAEGTVSKWLKQVGDRVERDQPVVEISTDKVDAEIPAPASGVLAEVKVQAGETVEVGAILAVIETEAAAGAAAAPAPKTAAPEKRVEAAERVAVSRPTAERRPDRGPGDGPDRPSVQSPGTAERESRREDGKRQAVEERGERRSTPLVRRIAAEHGIDISRVPGTGSQGRVTKHDILAFIEQQAKPTTPAPVGRPVVAPAGDVSEFWYRFYDEVRHPEVQIRDTDRVEPMDKIRRLTAEHMVLAKRVAAHVHSFIEIDFTRIDQIRAQMRQKWEGEGVKVSYTAFTLWACARILREFPRVNATISGDSIVYRGEVNLGMAVDLDPGLIVPVLHRADELSLAGLAVRAADLAERARTRKLLPNEIQGGTFTLTNPGVFGTVVGMPIVPRGQAAILGTGSIEKRPVALTDPATGADVLGVRKRAYFSLGYDHRIVDGADAARFLSRLKQLLESFPEQA
ncbi:MAG: 2-oxo acid dehydrogenase subunit E2 [Gemmatimonadetes bacterium]|nr:2-oxo acid dehydrogenase subunit E2 [Gemmatimonadota bacterium]